MICAFVWFVFFSVRSFWNKLCFVSNWCSRREKIFQWIIVHYVAHSVLWAIQTCIFFDRFVVLSLSFHWYLHVCTWTGCTLPVSHLVICDIEIDISKVNNTNFICEFIFFIRVNCSNNQWKKRQRAITISLKYNTKQYHRFPYKKTYHQSYC